MKVHLKIAIHLILLALSFSSFALEGTCPTPEIVSNPASFSNLPGQVRLITPGAPGVWSILDGRAGLLGSVREWISARIANGRVVCEYSTEATLESPRERVFIRTLPPARWEPIGEPWRILAFATTCGPFIDSRGGRTGTIETCKFVGPFA